MIIFFAFAKKSPCEWQDLCNILSKSLFFQVDCVLPVLDVHFSETIYKCIMGACGILKRKDEPAGINAFHVTKIDAPTKLPSFNFSVAFRLDKLIFDVDLEDNAEGSSIASLVIGDMDIRFVILPNSLVTHFFFILEYACNNILQKQVSRVEIYRIMDPCKDVKT